MTDEFPSRTHLIFPKDPPGFAVLVDLDTTQLLSIEKIYLIAIAVVHDWAFVGWDHFISSHSARATKAFRGLTVAWRSIAYPTQRYQLQIKHLILGMLHLIDQMTKAKYFCVSTYSVLLHRQGIGHIELLATGAVASHNRSSSDENLSLKSVFLPTPTGLRSLIAPRRIVDPEDSDFVIFYERKSEPMSHPDFLSTILYAIATAAQGSNNEYCQDLGGFNEKRNVVYRIHGKRPTDSGYLLTDGMVMRGLRLLSTGVYDSGASAEVRFRFEYRGDVLGGGAIELSDFAGNTAAT